MLGTFVWVGGVTSRGVHCSNFLMAGLTSRTTWALGLELRSVLTELHPVHSSAQQHCAPWM